jgi:hypothetical protein
MITKETEHIPGPGGYYRAPMFLLGLLARIFGAVMFALLMGYFVMLLWNWLMPGIFHLVTIDYWQAFGIILLGKLIFASPIPPMHGRRHKPWKRDWHENMDWKGGDDWDVKGGWHQWKYYKDYWRSEGKDAFEKYLDKMNGKTDTKKRSKK